MNFGEDEWGGEDSSFLQRKWGSAFLLVKPRSCSGKSPTFFGKSPTFFGKKSNVFAARSEVGTLVGGFWEANAGQKEESRGALREKMGGFEGEVIPFFSLSISPK